MPVTQSNPEPHIRLRTDRRDNGYVEIGVYVDAILSGDYPVFAAAVLRTALSSKWRIGSRTFRTKADAMEMALTIARNTHAYKIHIEQEAR